MKNITLHQLPENKIPSGWWDRESSSLSSYDAEQIESAAGEPTEAWYWYCYGSYEGAGQMILHNSCGWFLHDMGHCSCYGPTCHIELTTAHASLEALVKNCTAELQGLLTSLVEAASQTEAHKNVAEYEH